MFNTSQINTQQFNAGIVGITGVVSWDITYGSYILHKTDNIHLNFADINNGSIVENNIYNKPDIDGVGLNSYFLRAKTVTLNGTLKASSKQELEQLMSTMLGQLAIPNRTLQVLNAGNYYRAEAYCTNLNTIFKREHFHNTFVSFSVVFQVNSPFWESLILNSITYSRTATLTEEIINTGTAKADPVITISFNSATTVTEIELVFWVYTLTILETISASDIVRIDSENKEVLLNGVAIDYTWRLPLLELGSNPFTITIDGTYNVDIGINYRDKFI